MAQNNLNLRSGDPTYTIDQIQLSGNTYELRDNSAIHNLNGYWTSGQTQDAITAATGALAESIAEQHYQTSGDVQNAISGKADTTAVTEAISEAVSGKADTTAVTQSITQAISGKANVEDAVTNLSFVKENGQNTLLFSLQKNGGWLSGEVALRVGTGLTMNDKTVKVDFTKVAKPSDIPSVTGYADSVAYDTNTKYMKFYHGGTGGTEVFSFDASPFLIDGMVDNVEIKDVTISGESVTCLVISFNTAAGKQDINIPISEIFDASNYYTKDEVDAELSAKTDNNVFTAYTAATDTALGNKADTTAMTQAISEAVSGKADTTAVTESINEAVSGKADSADIVDITGFALQNSNTLVMTREKNGTTMSPLTVVKAGNGLTVTTDAMANKEFNVDTNTIQEKLVSGTSIKTVGGNSLLGSGDIAFPAGLQVSVQDTTLVFG